MEICKKIFLLPEDIKTFKNILKTNENININYKDIGKNSILFMACLNGHLPIVKILLEYEDIDIDEQCSYFETPLLVASEKGYYNIVKLLVKRGADITKESCFQQSSLHHACCEGYFRIFKLLLDILLENQKYNKQDDKYLLLHTACKSNNSDIVHYLVEKGFNVNKQDSDGNTPLHYLFKMHINNRDLIIFLIKNGTNINIKNNKNEILSNYVKLLFEKNLKYEITFFFKKVLKKKICEMPGLKIKPAEVLMLVLDYLI